MASETFQRLIDALVAEHEQNEGSYDLQGHLSEEELKALTPITFSIKRVAELLFDTRNNVGQLIQEVYNLRWFNAALRGAEIRYYPQENKWLLISRYYPLGQALTAEELEYLYICCTNYNSIEKEDYILYAFNGV